MIFERDSEELARIQDAKGLLILANETNDGLFQTLKIEEGCTWLG
jgi:hypothetical protein